VPGVVGFEQLERVFDVGARREHRVPFADDRLFVRRRSVDARAEQLRVERFDDGWIDALAAALRRLGDDRTTARQKAEQAVLEIQGALVLTRALDDIKVFSRALADSRKRLMNIK